MELDCHSDLDSVVFNVDTGLIGGGHCDWPIAKWGCLIGGDRLQILINWGVFLGRIQKTWPLAKRDCLIGGDILILYELYLVLLTPLTESIIYQSVRLAAQECALSRQHSLSLLQDRVRRCHCGLLHPCSHSSRFPASLCARTAAELCEKTPASG